MPLGLTAVLPEIVKAKLYALIFEAIRNFLVKEVPILAAKKQAELNQELATLAVGGSFQSLPVTAATANTVTLLVRGQDMDALYPVPNVFPPKLEKIPGLTIGLARADIQIERWINLTDSSKPIVGIVDIQSYAVEITVSKEDHYSIHLGGGHDRLRGYRQFLVELDLLDLDLRFRGYWAQSDKGGFILQLESKLPFPIPIGSTGFGFTDLGILYGERFAPWLKGAVAPKDPIAEMRTADALDYIAWAQRKRLEQWLPVPDALKIYGISADIGDVGTAGRIIRTREAGLTYLDSGPTIVWGGTLRLLDKFDVASISGALDVPSQSMSAAAWCKCDVVNGGFTITGGSQWSASLKDQSKTWFAIGNYAMDGCKVSFLGGLFEMYGGYRLVPLQGSAARAGARIHAEGEFAGFGGGIDLSIDVSGHIGWNPVEFGGELHASGSAWIKIFGERVAAGVNLDVAVQVARPKKLVMTADFWMSFPWPIPELHVPVTIFNVDEKDFDAPAAALALGPALPIAFIHRATGTLGKIEGTAVDVWPDISFDIPFRSVALAPTHVVNRQSTDGTEHIGADSVTVMHEVTSLKITKVDEATGHETDVPNVSAAWLGTNVAGQNGRSSRLAIPCNDPLGWLQEFVYSNPATATPVEKKELQTFGRGPNHEFDSTGAPATFECEALSLTSGRTFQLVNLPWIAPYQRALIVSDLSICITSDSPTGLVVVPVTEFDIRIVSAREPRLAIGTASSTAIVVRILEAGLSEWSVLVTRPISEARKPLLIRGLEDALCIAAIGYTQNTLIESTPGHETVLGPGIYKLYVDGWSESRLGSAKPKRTDWHRIAQRFVVKAPPLRPYIRYATLGDERAFGVKRPGWNPNPPGFGFGHYRSHKGVIRSRVAYLSQIYSDLLISCDRGETPVKVPVTACTDGSVAGSRLSQEWQSIVSGVPRPEEELLFDVTVAPGLHVLEVRREKPDGTREIIDEWPYRVSHYSSPVDHLRPQVPTVSRLFGPFGVKTATPATPPAIPPGLDFDVISPAKMVAQWALPPWIPGQPELGDPNAALGYLRLLDWAGAFQQQVLEAENSVLGRPSAAELNLLVDATGVPGALLLMTDEPCDWRRVDVTVVHGAGATFDRRFSTRLFPSPDGCSALFLLTAEGVPVRIPRGILAMRVRYEYRVDPLASLIETANPAATRSEFVFAISHAVGRDWNV